MKNKMKIIIPVLIMGVAFCQAYGQRPEGPPPAVRVEKVVTLNESEPKTYVGTASADATVNIVARISGTLWKSHVDEGNMVKKGDLLYEIEDTIYKANTAVAEAALKQMEAEYEYAKKEFDRYQKLFKAEATAKTTFEGSFRSLQFYEAKIEEAKATLVLRQNDLSYTKIYSPVTGRIGESIYSEGNYITPDKGTLARIVKFDPIKIRFAMSEADFFNNFKDGKLSDATIDVFRADGTKFLAKWEVVFIDNQVDQNTGTILLQLAGDNPKMELIPGGYVKVKFAEKYKNPQPSIRITAVMTDGKGHYVYTVGQENKAERREVVIGKQVGDMQIITKGLDAGELVIVGGLHKVQLGSPVNPVSLVKTEVAK